MQWGPFRFDRLEFAGSLGDLGTIIPLATALMVIAGLSVSTVLLMVGLFYISSGLYFKLPIPVQPLKVVSAIAIAFPAKITLPVMGAAGILMGAILILLAATGLVDWMARFFTRPIMRGIQLGLGFILLSKGIGYVMKTRLFIHGSELAPSTGGAPVNTVMGTVAFFGVLAFISSKRFPAALLLVASGILCGFAFGALENVRFAIGPTDIRVHVPSASDFANALMLLVIPQLPLTLGNAVMGTTDTATSLFGKGPQTQRATYRAFSISMGLMNTATGFLAGMPMCHGAGGLAAHYRFGARTGGSNLMIGALFVLIALVFGKAGIALLSCVPNAFLGILLIFAGLELSLLVRDIDRKNDLFIVLLIAGIGFATTNMAVAFAFGIATMWLMKRLKIDL